MRAIIYKQESNTDSFSTDIPLLYIVIIQTLNWNRAYAFIYINA